MKFTFGLVGCLLASTVSSLAIPEPEAEADALANPMPTPNIEDMSDADLIKSAAWSWLADTAVTSAFIDAVTSKKIRSQSNYLALLTAAINAETALYEFKGILDDELWKDQGVISSNGTLSDGCLAGTAYWLYYLKGKNYKKDCKEILQVIEKINFGDVNYGGRCTEALPAIDQYFAAADRALAASTGDRSLKRMRAVRPVSCGRYRERDLEEVAEVEDVE